VVLADLARASRQLITHLNHDRLEVVPWQKLELAKGGDLDADAGAADGA